MSVKLMPQRLFLITYDDGDSSQTLKVPIELYANESEFQKNIISMKCLHCNFESHFNCVEKEDQNK